MLFWRERLARSKQTRSESESGESLSAAALEKLRANAEAEQKFKARQKKKEEAQRAIEEEEAKRKYEAEKVVAATAAVSAAVSGALRGAIENGSRLLTEAASRNQRFADIEVCHVGSNGYGFEDTYPKRTKTLSDKMEVSSEFLSWLFQKYYGPLASVEVNRKEFNWQKCIRAVNRLASTLPEYPDFERLCRKLGYTFSFDVHTTQTDLSPKEDNGFGPPPTPWGIQSHSIILRINY